MGTNAQDNPLLRLHYEFLLPLNVILQLIPASFYFLLRRSPNAAQLFGVSECSVKYYCVAELFLPFKLRYCT